MNEDVVYRIMTCKKNNEIGTENCYMSVLMSIWSLQT